MTDAARARARLVAAQLRDVAECAASPLAFVERHVSIETPKGVPIPFRLWPAQRDALARVHERDVVVVLKARRLGLSWLVIAYAVWLALFQPGSRVVMLCKTGEDAREMVGRARRILERIERDAASAHVLAGWAFDRDSTERVELRAPDGRASVFRAINARPRAARQETASLVLWDESAFADDAGEVWAAIEPTIEGGGKLVALSTGNGVTGQGAFFADLFERSASGASGADAIFLPYNARPGRDAQWRAAKVALIGDAELALREYPETSDEALAAVGVTYAYGPARVAAVTRIGRDLDDALAAIDPLALEVRAALREGGIVVGIDWGESTHALIGVPLEGGGVYIADEVVAGSLEPGDSTRLVVDAVNRVRDRLAPPGQAPRAAFTEARYDAAGVQSMRTCVATLAGLGETPRTTSVPFSRFKAEAFGYARRLGNRAVEGRSVRVLAVSPRCVELLRQMRGLLVDPETGAIRKGDDHGPDALLALLAPVAATHRGVVESDREAG